MNRKAIIGLLVIGLLLVAGVTATQINAGRHTAPARPEVLRLKPIADIPLNGGTSRLDYQSIDPDAGRLYMSHLGANLVTVFDLRSQQVIADIPNIRQPHGVLAVPSLHRVYATATGENQLAVIDSQSLAVLQRVPAGGYPDGLAYDPGTNRIFVSDESGGTVSVIDAGKNTPVGTIDMGGEVGNTQYDPVSKHIYSAAQGRGQLVAIDPANATIVERNDLPGCSGPHGFYIDASTHYAFVTCESNARLVVFDLAARKIIASDTVGQIPDVLAFDQGLHRLYVASESGVLAVFSVEKDAVRKMGQAFLANNAHTVSVDQATHRVYLPLENVNGHPVLRIMEPAQAASGRQAQPGVGAPVMVQPGAGTQTPQAMPMQPAAAMDRKQVDQAFGKAGAVQPGNVYRVHFWANDDVPKPAHGLRTALDQTHSAKPASQ